jgi:hypothetical protein
MTRLAMLSVPAAAVTRRKALLITSLGIAINHFTIT